MAGEISEGTHHRWRFYYMEKWYGPSISEPVIKNETDEI